MKKTGLPIIASVSVCCVFVFLLFSFSLVPKSFAEDWIYTVKSGDSLWTLSKKHLVSMNFQGPLAPAYASFENGTSAEPKAITAAEGIVILTRDNFRQGRASFSRENRKSGDITTERFPR